MYNFRYHLITIVAIFAALALGLLLGVAITGSDLVKDASTNLAESLTQQFDELNATNDELTGQLDVERLLSTQLFAGWQSERLNGRTIVVLTQTDEAGSALEAELVALVEASGGIPISIRIDSVSGFGLDDKDEAAALKELIPEVEGEGYEVTVANALTAEWTDLMPQTAVHTRYAFEADYPLTNQLLKSKRITVQVDYRRLLEGLKAIEVAESSDEVKTSEATVLETQQIALGLAQQLQLPYGANGIIDASFSGASEGAQGQADMFALQLALAFDAQGAAGNLSSLQGLEAAGSETISDAEEQSFATVNYFALLVGEQANAELIVKTSQNSGISSVFSPLDQSGHYSIVALLSGALKGSYGLDQNGVRVLPAAPSDTAGNAPFVGRASS